MVCLGCLQRELLQLESLFTSRRPLCPWPVARFVNYAGYVSSAGRGLPLHLHQVVVTEEVIVTPPHTHTHMPPIRLNNGANYAGQFNQNYQHVWNIQRNQSAQLVL